MFNITLQADTFQRALHNVALFAGTDDTLPVLTTVRVVSDGKSVKVEATDRYTAARANVPAYEDEDGNPMASGEGVTYLSRDAVKAITSHKLARTGRQTVQLMASDDMSVTVIWVLESASQTFPPAAVAGCDYPNTDRIYSGADKVDADKRDAGKLSYNPKFLARLAKIRPEWRGDANVTFEHSRGEGGLLTRWKCGDVEGLIMQARIID